MSPRKAAALRNRDDERGIREHLIVTAERLIAERGAAGLTVRAIASAAGVADGVLYNHFSDKEQLLAAALRSYIDTAHRGLGVLPVAGTGAVETNLREYLRAGLALHRAVLPAVAGLITRPAVLAKVFELAPSQQAWRDQLQDYLRAERDLKRLSPHARVEAATDILVGICHDRRRMAGDRAPNLGIPGNRSGTC